MDPKTSLTERTIQTKHKSGLVEIQAYIFTYTVLRESFQMGYHVEPDHGTKVHSITHLDSGLRVTSVNTATLLESDFDVIAAAIKALDRQTSPARMRSALTAAVKLST